MSYFTPMNYDEVAMSARVGFRIVEHIRAGTYHTLVTGEPTPRPVIVEDADDSDE